MTEDVTSRLSAPQRALPVGPYVLLLCVATLIVAGDQGAKAWVRAALSGRRIEILGGAIRLEYAQNTGAAFSIFRSGGVVFALIAVLVAAGILVYYRRVARSPIGVRVALGLILGGALGNLIDRVRFGYVVDFIDLRWWPVFNIADTAIVVGAIVLVVYSILWPVGDG